MKRITKADINFKLDTKLIKIDDFSIKFYTVNPTNFYISKNQDNVIQDGDNYIIKLDWNELVTIGEGVLEYRAINNTIDNGYVDNYYNKSVERTTEYYINSDIVVDEDEAKNYGELIAELGQEIDEEIVRSISADTELLLELNQETATRQQNVLDLTDLITSASTEIATLSGNVYAKDEVDELIDNINISGYTTIEEFDEACEVTAAALNNLNDRKLDASAYTPTDLSNYYAKSETSGASQISTALSDKADCDSVYLKSETSGKTELSTAFNGKLDVSAYTPTDLTNYYTKSETSGASQISTALSDKLDITAYTPTDLSNYYTKAQVDAAIDDIDVSGQLKDYLTISAFTLSAKTINDKIDTKADKTALNTKVSQAAFDTYTADTVVAIENKANVDDLQEVAFSGDYNDLKNKPSVSPSIPDYWDAGEY